jgi:hypothetical protein
MGILGLKDAGMGMGILDFLSFPFCGWAMEFWSMEKIGIITAKQRLADNNGIDCTKLEN